MDGLVVATEGDHSVLSQEPLQFSVGGRVPIGLPEGRVVPADVAVAVAGVHWALDGKTAVDRESLRLRKVLVTAGVHLGPVHLGVEGGLVEAGRHHGDGGRLGVDALPRGGGGVQGEHWGECEEITYRRMIPNGAELWLNIGIGIRHFLSLPSSPFSLHR